MKKKNSFTVPKLCNRGNDLAKSWYVYFTYIDKFGIAKQFRFKHDLNTFKTKRERDREAASMCSVLYSRLSDGWNPILDKIEKPKEDVTISQALDNLLSIKKSFITPRSYKTYRDQLSLFNKWLIIAKYDKLFVQNFKNIQARQYFDWLLQVKKYSGKTHNGHLGVISTFFNGLVERETIPASPIKGIKKVSQETGKNTTYSTKEEKTLEKYLLEHDKNFYFVTRFIRYCFFRRSELAKLQVKHIRWENKTIIVPSESSKNRNQDSITISKSLERIIIEMGVLDMEPNLYIFGKHFISSPDKLKRVDDYTDYQRKINRELKIKEECTFYSWKHTGAVELYNITKDPYVVMRQCRHSDIKMTMIYLRSLGCGVNEQVREW